MPQPDRWLDRLTVASPCDADWEQMRGDARVRFCGQCELNVFNLSGMTRREASHLLRATQGKVCVRFFRRHDGTVLTTDCPRGLAAVRRNVARAVGGVVALLLGLIGFAVAAAGGGGNRAATRTANWGDRLPKPFKTVLNPFLPEPRPMMVMGAPPPFPPPPPAQAQQIPPTTTGNRGG